MPKQTVSQPSVAQDLQNELAEVQRQLLSAIDELYSPLSDLVRAQFKLAAPLLRAAVVLTAGVGEPDTDELQEKRILLASALEMLYIALHIHQRLLTGASVNGAQTNDKSLLGSIILAGDYCFSRSAILAARTNNPEVVMIFSTALKIVSEGKLRQYFTQEATPFNENHTLSEAGARAAATLANRAPENVDAITTLGATVLSPILTPLSMPQALTTLQQARWTELSNWLAALP